jgi:hypothetical protein
MRQFVALLLCACNHATLSTDAATRDLSLPPGDFAMACVASATEVNGAIPNSPFAGRWGWAWYETGDCRERVHLKLSGDAEPETSGTFIDVMFPYSPQLGDNQVIVTLSWGEPPVIGMGTATLSKVEPLASTEEIRLQGTLMINDNGLQLSGSFAVRHCPMLDIYCV